MLWQRLPYEALAPKVVVSALPKAGLHLGVRMVSPLVQPQPGEGVFESEWVGTFSGHAWTTDWIDSRAVCYRLGRVQPGRYVKGHLGWRKEIEEFMYFAGVGHVFVHRDLRDVAVSQAHHILAENDRQFQHDGKGVFRRMYEQAPRPSPPGPRSPHPPAPGALTPRPPLPLEDSRERGREEGFERVLLGVIEGVGPWAGLLERWRLYEPWLRSEWTCCVSFEELVGEPEAAAERILVYLLGRAPGALGMEVRIDEPEARERVGRMAAAAGARHLSPTFRRGEVGTWREVWTDAVEEAWGRMIARWGE